MRVINRHKSNKTPKSNKMLVGKEMMRIRVRTVGEKRNSVKLKSRWRTASISNKVRRKVRA